MCSMVGRSEIKSLAYSFNKYQEHFLQGKFSFYSNCRPAECTKKDFFLKACKINTQTREGIKTKEKPKKK